MSDFLWTKLAKVNFVDMICIDLQKAVNTVEHGILLDKLKAMDVSEMALK